MGGQRAAVGSGQWAVNSRELPARRGAAGNVALHRPHEPPILLRQGEIFNGNAN